MNNIEALDDFLEVLKKMHPNTQISERDKMLLGMAINHAFLIKSEEANAFENVVEIGEMLGGYWQVIINDLPIANYRDKEEADQLVDHFVAINKDKNIKRL